MNKKDESHSMKNVSSVETRGALLVIPDVEQNVEAFAPTSDKAKAKTTEPVVNMHVSSPEIDERTYEFRDENSKPEAQE